MLTPKYFLNSNARGLCFAKFGENNYSLKHNKIGEYPKNIWH